MTVCDGRLFTTGCSCFDSCQLLVITLKIIACDFQEKRFRLQKEITHVFLFAWKLGCAITAQSKTPLLPARLLSPRMMQQPPVVVITAARRRRFNMHFIDDARERVTREIITLGYCVMLRVTQPQPPPPPPLHARVRLCQQIVAHTPSSLVVGERIKFHHEKTTTSEEENAAASHRRCCSSQRV